MSFDRWSAATEVVVGLVRFGGRGAPEVIPHSCQFWHTTALLRPVKYTKIAKIAQKFAFSMLQSTPARKKYSTMTYMSYACAVDQNSGNEFTST